MLVCDFLLSSPRVGYVDSDSASVSFWKSSGENIERRLICRFRFWNYQLLTKFWWKDWTASRSDPWTWKNWKCWQIWKNCWNLILEVDFISIFKLWYWNYCGRNFQNVENQQKIAKKLDFWSLVNPKICSGPALRAIFKILAMPRVSFATICICNTYWIWFVETVS